MILGDLIKTISKNTSPLLIIFTVLALCLSVVGPSTTFEVSDTNELLANTPIPEPTSEPVPIPPADWSGYGDFVISYDEPGTQDAEMPDIAVAPPGSPWEGSIHCVWMELNNEVGDIPYSEIHYSMSDANQKGIEWSNDEASENDTILSNSAESTSIEGDAYYPSITIDAQGTIHVVWSQSYPDFTWEVHYSRSTDNGQTWSGYDGESETLVSYRAGFGLDSFWINSPRVVVSSNPTIIHVTWSELVNGEAMRAMYSRSLDDGQTWSGAMDGDRVISDPFSMESANMVDLASGGQDNKILHVIWTQDVEILPGWGTGIFYVRSMDSGDNWEPPRLINMPALDHYAFTARVDAYGDNVHAVWDMDSTTMQSEIYYGGSEDNGGSWTSQLEQRMISSPDGNPVMDPVITTSPGSGGTEVHVVWTETDDLSPLGSTEIHYSMTPDAFGASPWTGVMEDNVISFPDPLELANAYSPSISMANIDGEWKTQVIWNELNVLSTVDNTRGGTTTMAADNHEIHYIPETTYNIPIASTGWNFISVPLVQNDETITTVLDDSWGDSATTWSDVYWYDATDAADPWKFYNNAISGLADLSTIDHSMGFWIKITSLGDGNLSFAGDYPTSTIINLKAGWNLVGYPAQNDSAYNIADLKANVTGVQTVEGYDSGGTYLLQSLADSYVMKRGEAYWIKVSSDVSWTIDW